MSHSRHIQRFCAPLSVVEPSQESNILTHYYLIFLKPFLLSVVQNCIQQQVVMDVDSLTGCNINRDFFFLVCFRLIHVHSYLKLVIMVA